MKTRGSVIINIKIIELELELSAVAIINHQLWLQFEINDLEFLVWTIVNILVRLKFEIIDLEFSVWTMVNNQHILQF